MSTVKSSESQVVRRRRWGLRFSLRSLLLAMLVISLPLGWIAVRRREAQNRRASIARIQELGGTVCPGHETPRWRQVLLDEASQNQPLTIFLNDTRVSDDDLSALTCLKSLLSLDLGSTKTSDAGLAHLRDLTNLQQLCLDATRVSDAGLKQLTGLTKLQYLHLEETPGVTDAGRDWLRKRLPQAEID